MSDYLKWIAILANMEVFLINCKLFLKVPSVKNRVTKTTARNWSGSFRVVTMRQTDLILVFSLKLEKVKTTRTSKHIGRRPEMPQGNCFRV